MVAGGELVANILPMKVEVEDFDRAAGRHHIFDRDAVQFEQAGKNGAVFLRHQVGRFKNEGA